MKKAFASIITVAKRPIARTLGGVTIHDPYRPVQVPVDRILFGGKSNSQSTHLRFCKVRIAPGVSIEVRRVGAVLDGNWTRTVLSEVGMFPVLRARFAEGRPWEETHYHRLFHSRLAHHGFGRDGSRSWEEFRDSFLAKVDQLYLDIRDNGYRSQQSLGGLSEDEVEIVIGADGALQNVDGRHRLSIAKLLGIKTIPAIVNVVHRDFYQGLQTSAPFVTPEMAVDAALQASAPPATQ